MLLYKKLLLMTFGMTLVYYLMIHGPYNINSVSCFCNIMINAFNGEWMGVVIA